MSVLFAAAHYAALAVFVAACWGFGHALITRLMRPDGPLPRDPWLEHAMAATLGIGGFVCAFQVLGIAGAFRPAGVLALVAAGVLAAVVQAPRGWRELQARRAAPVPQPLSWPERGALAVVALVALPALVAPLAPPAAFDELMYHLPYARTVAQSGTLGIHDWLRYPWFPYNVNLLYAAALLVGDDVLPHLLNALAGALSAWMLYRVGLRYAGRVVACGGAAIWIGLGDYSNALIDMGVALFVLAGCVALWWWREAPPQRRTRWLCVAAFCFGVAAGSKYQALTFLPLVGSFVLWRERRVRVLALASACLLLPCIYWYARNAIGTGDPFNPIGARLFGFSNWNAADYKNQFDDVRAHAAWPNVTIWAVLLAPFSPLARQSAALRAVLVFSAYSLVVWFATSRYPRYLTASYPLIALGAAIGWTVLARAVARGVRRVVPAAAGSPAWPGIGRRSGGLLLAVFVAVSVRQLVQKVQAVSPTPASRDAFLSRNVPGYGVMQYLRRNPHGRVYQVALSEAIYYGPDAVWGDTLGPWRYSDFVGAAPAEMARKLAANGFGALAIAEPYVASLAARPGFDRHFVLLHASDGARAYRILADAP